jgi:PAS domain S-box-containing protein
MIAEGIMKQGSVSHKILTSVLIVSVVVAALWGVLEYQFRKLEQVDRLQQRSSLMADRLTNALVYPLWNLNDDEISTTLSLEIADPETEAILLLNSDGTFHSGTFKNSRGVVTHARGSAGRSPPYPASFITIHRPIIKLGETIGFISLHISDRLLRANLQRSALGIILRLSVMFTIISTVIYFCLKRLIIRPITELEHAVSGLSPDNLTVDLTGNGCDELASLARSFKTLTGELADSFGRREALLSELHERDERFRSIVSNLPGVIYRLQWEPAGRVIFISEHIRDLTGYPPEDFLRNRRWSLRDMIIDSDRLKVYEAITAAVADRRPFDVQYRITDSAGKIRWVRETGQASGYCDGAFQWLDGVILDTTEIHSKDEQLHQSQKMEIIGMLAGGIAHDFNNILTCIFGTISMIRMGLDDETPYSSESLREDLSTMELAAGRAADLVGQILSLSMKKNVQESRVNLIQSVNHVRKLCHSSVDRSVEITFTCDEKQAVVMADAIQIEQVILNICVNAAHAMTIMRPPGETWGGCLDISLRRFSADRIFCLQHPEARERDYWVLSFKDTGVGMTPEVREQIFNPFFTTKETGTGTGLGLSVTFNIVTIHGGFVRLQSEAGVGTNFLVYLPAAQGEAICDDVEEPSLPRGSGTILVIDDEEIIRHNVALILRECGYRVHQADNGESGLEIYRERKEELDLILLDLVMPKISGQEVYRRLREDACGTPILLTTGFMMDMRVQEILRDSRVSFLQKPYSTAELARSVADVISPQPWALEPPCD